MKRITATILAVITVIGISPWAAAEEALVKKQPAGKDGFSGAFSGSKVGLASPLVVCLRSTGDFVPT